MFAGFIAQTRSDPFQWGVNDCALWCASAVHFETGIDPAADMRGTYASKFECYQVLRGEGGLLACVTARMARAGFHSRMPADGVAIVRDGGQRLCALIVSGRAITKTPKGLRYSDDFKVEKGWSWSRH